MQCVFTMAGGGKKWQATTTLTSLIDNQTEASLTNGQINRSNRWQMMQLNDILCCFRWDITAPSWRKEMEKEVFLSNASVTTVQNTGHERVKTDWRTVVCKK